MQVNDNDYSVSVLVVDDEDHARQANENLLKNQFKKISNNQLNIKKTVTMAEALSLLSSETFHVVLLDKDLKEGKKTLNGISYIPEIKNIQPCVQIIVITAHDDTKFAVEAIKMGACGYLEKRIDPEYQFYREAQIQQALIRAKSEIEQMRREASTSQKDVPENYVCNSPVMKRLDMQLRTLAEFSSPVLFLGDTGLGKTVSARRLSILRSQFLGQNNRPFIAVNSAAISSSLAESLIFGHEKGAFTGATESKQGFFEQANGGDLFLDEIGDANMEIQTKLLKIVEEGTFRRVGGTREFKTSARILFATNKDIKQMVRDGTFREDLYARIAALIVQLPPLNERKQDIPGICRSLIKTITKDTTSRKFMFEDLPEDLKKYLCRDNIPYNIRGIYFDLSRLMVMSPLNRSESINFDGWKSTLGVSRAVLRKKSDCLDYSDLLNRPTNFLNGEFPGLKKTTMLLEKRIIEEAMKIHDKPSHIAKILKLSPSNAIAKVRKYIKTEEPDETG